MFRKLINIDCNMAKILENCERFSVGVLNEQ